MSGLSDRIDEELVRATKARDRSRLSALRMIRSALQNRRIEKRAPLTDDEVVQVLSGLVKRTKESIEQFRKGKREDLVRKEEAELQVILSFLPEQMGEEEVRGRLQEIIRDVKAAGLKDLGKVMKAAMGEMKGRVDGRLVQQIARELLSS
jgi:hypothetical protein